MRDIFHALVLEMHQPSGNLRDLLDHSEWEAKEILFAYDRYRQQLKTSADREQASGAKEEAVERYARYLVLGRVSQEERAQLLQLLATEKGLTPAAAGDAL